MIGPDHDHYPRRLRSVPHSRGSRRQREQRQWLLMRWLAVLLALLACVAVWRATARGADGVFTSEDGHGRTCDHGPVTIEIQELTACPPPATPAHPAPDGHGGYSYGTNVDMLLVCYAARAERWSDWPECGGEKLEAPR